MSNVSGQLETSPKTSSLKTIHGFQTLNVRPTQTWRALGERVMYKNIQSPENKRKHLNRTFKSAQDPNQTVYSLQIHNDTTDILNLTSWWVILYPTKYYIYSNCYLNKTENLVVPLYQY